MNKENRDTNSDIEQEHESPDISDSEIDEVHAIGRIQYPKNAELGHRSMYFQVTGKLEYQ